MKAAKWAAAAARTIGALLKETRKEILVSKVYYRQGRHPFEFHLIRQDSGFQTEDLFPDREDFYTPQYRRGGAGRTRALWATATGIVLEDNDRWAERHKIAIVTTEKDLYPGNPKGVATFRLCRIVKTKAP